MTYDCIIIGGGIAGLQASIQLGRYHRSVLIIDSGDGRSSLCRQYNNILGYPEGVSGEELREKGGAQAEKFGVERVEEVVMGVYKNASGFVVQTNKGKECLSRTVLMATGVKDHFPDIPGIRPCLGLSVYICPDCDGYEITDKKTIVMGSGDVGAQMVLTLLYWSKDLIFVNHGGEKISLDLQGKLRENSVPVQQVEVKRVIQDEGTFKGIETVGGLTIHGEKGFLAFGGNHVRTDLMKKLGAKTNEKGHLVVDARTKMTSIDGLWAAGDAVAHSELVTAAMGEGSLAAIWLQKWLLEK